MSEDNTVISIHDLGKMYKLYKNPRDKVWDAFGLGFFKKNYYREFWALRGVDLTIHKGERVGFIGHNGAGKSTLLKLITGNIKPSEGQVQVNGSIQALLEMGTGFHPEFTGRENIRASLAYQGISKDEISRCEEEIIEFTELGDYIEQPVKSYSAGMYSRLAFATTTAIVPEVMIIDEVLGAGDAYFNGKCVDRMRKLTSEEGATVLFVSHDLQSVQNLCDRVIWINKGKIMYDGEVLTGIKMYLQSVRQNEEQRLKLRDIKALNRETIIQDNENDLYDTVKFRFQYSSENESQSWKIYKIRVLVDGNEIDSIDVGASMDNDTKSHCHIIDEAGITSWGKPSKDQNGYYREYKNEYGTGKNAPFQIMISKAYKMGFDLCIDADIDSRVKIQIYNKNSNEFVDCLVESSTGSNIRVVLPQAVTEEKEDRIDIISTQQAEILDVSLVSDDGTVKNVFSYDDSIDKIRFKALLNESYNKLFVNVCIYTMKGDLIISSLQLFEETDIEGDIEFEYPLDTIKIGPGEYTVSVGIFEDVNVIDNSREQKFIAMFDRALSFKVEKPLDYALGIGIIVSDTLMRASKKDKMIYGKIIRS